MANVIINDQNLTNIANAIRGKNGTTTTYKPSEMAAAISAIETGSGGDLPEEAFIISGDCSYMFINNNWNWFINNYGSQVTTSGITSLISMFADCTQLTNIPFELNVDNGSNSVTLDNIFAGCEKITDLPKINNCKPKSMSNIFKGCNYLRQLPNDFVDWFDWSYIENQTSAYNGAMDNIFKNCDSLRTVPTELFSHVNKYATSSKSVYYYGFMYCYAIDELTNLPYYNGNQWTSNGFNSTFTSCSRLKNIIFASLKEGDAAVRWKSQTIDLRTYVGYAQNTSYILSRNSGITADKEVTDDATYQALKNDPDWFTTKIEYSRYNHDSAVATINSLPDTSAYLATAGGTNTIKFKGDAGSATDGGAISSLTPEEIAVATARGWTVSLV